MKKIAIILGLLCLTQPVFGADVDGRTEKGGLGRAATVMTRGLLNVVGVPFEIPATMARETESHSKLWPITGIPRSINNIFIRAASGVNDFFFMPFSTAFSNDISPMTEPMGLPDYPWQVHEE